MGQVNLSALDSLGRAAVRAIRWVTYDCTNEVLESLDRFVHDMAAVQGDFLSANAQAPKGMRQAGGGGRSTSWRFV
jgi:hypothetical protein